MNNELRKDCPMRHENGNCLPAGGFCTAVNNPICEALHNAYDAGCRAAFLGARQKAKENEPLTLDELRQMDEEPVYVQTGDGREGYVILAWEYGSAMLYGLKFEPVELDTEFYNMRHNDPDGHFGLHILGWLAYRYKLVDGKENNNA